MEENTIPQTQSPETTPSQQSPGLLTSPSSEDAPSLPSNNMAGGGGGRSGKREGMIISKSQTNFSSTPPNKVMGNNLISAQSLREVSGGGVTGGGDGDKSSPSDFLARERRAMSIPDNNHNTIEEEEGGDASETASVAESSNSMNTSTGALKKSFRERTLDFLASRNKKNASQHKSIDILNSRGMVSKGIDGIEDATSGSGTGGAEGAAALSSSPNGTHTSEFSPTPPSTAMMPKNNRASILPMGKKAPSFVSSEIVTSPESQIGGSRASMMMRPATSNTNLSETIGYRSGRSGSNLPGIETQKGLPDSKTGPTSAEAAPYTAMSTIRSSRMSNMLSRSTSSNFGPAPIETAKLAAAATRTFKEFFITLLEEHDVTHLTHLGQNKKPKTFKLGALFGGRGDGIDPIDRIMWLGAHYKTVKADSAFSSPLDDAQSPTKSIEPNSARILDIDLEVAPLGLVYDDMKTAGLDMVSSGTLKALFDGLIIPIHQASSRFFIDSREVFRNLIEWYNVTSEGAIMPGAEPMLRRYKKAIQVRSLRVLLLWIRNHWEDFKENQQLMRELDDFVDYLSQESFGDNQKLVHAIREQILSQYTSQYIPMFAGIRDTDSGALWCPEIDTELFANDLTMVDHLLFRQMKPDVYFHILAKPLHLLGAGHKLHLKILLDYCGWFRMVSCYPSSVICKEENTKRKTMAIRLLIKIARHCLDLGNYQGAFALTYGLKRPASLMWYSAWEALPTKYQDMFKELNALMDYREGYKNYWEAIQKVKMPAIPFLAPYFHDLLLIQENSPASLDEEETDLSAKRMNFEKYYDMFSVAAELETFRLSSYHNLLKGDKESNGLLVQHIRFMSKQDDLSIGSSIIFASGSVPDDNPIFNSPMGMKAIKKIIHLLSGKSDSAEANPE